MKYITRNEQIFSAKSRDFNACPASATHISHYRDPEFAEHCQIQNAVLEWLASKEKDRS